MANAEAAAHLGALGEALGIAGLDWGPEGLRSLDIGGQIVVNIKLDEAQGELVLFAVAGSLASTVSSAQMLKLLEANRFWRGTSGATLSVDHHQPPRVILARRCHLQAVPPARFVAVFESFVDQLRDWSAWLAEADAAGAAPVPPAISMPFGHFA
jgi:hypothetical protein